MMVELGLLSFYLLATGCELDRAIVTPYDILLAEFDKESKEYVNISDEKFNKIGYQILVSIRNRGIIEFVHASPITLHNIFEG